MLNLDFEYVNNQDVCELSNIINATKFAYDHYTHPVANTGNSYLDYLYEMTHFLRFLPESIKVQPRGIQCKEEVLRNKLAALIITRQDLVEHYFSKDSVGEEDISAMWQLFEDGLPIPSAPSASELARISRLDEIKQDLCGYINSYSTRYGNGLLDPQITVEDLRDLLTSGNAQKVYECNDIAKFSYILNLLAASGKANEKYSDIAILDRRNYQNTVCCQEKLRTKGKKFRDTFLQPRPIKAKDLGKSLSQITDKGSAIYSAIRDNVHRIMEHLRQQEKK